jgi:hypothetical protein
MSFIDIAESRVWSAAADEAVVGREEAGEAAAVEIWGASR